MMFRNSSPKLHRALTYDPERSPMVKLRKRLLSEHQEESNAKKRMTEGNGDFTVTHCLLSSDTFIDVILETPTFSFLFPFQHSDWSKMSHMVSKIIVVLYIRQTAHVPFYNRQIRSKISEKQKQQHQ